MGVLACGRSEFVLIRCAAERREGSCWRGRAAAGRSLRSSLRLALTKAGWQGTGCEGGPVGPALFSGD